MLSILKKNLPLLLIILIAFLLRFIWLDKVPNAVGGDELTYVINAKAIALTGSDISGTWNPLTGFIFKYPLYTIPQAELPYFLLTPFVGIFGLSLFWIRIPFVLLSVLSVYLVYLITTELFNKKAGIFASLLTAVNPWSIYMARTSYEETPAIFFFLLSFYMLLVLKGRKILLTIPVLFLAFYSYVATKVSFLPFVFLIVLFSFFVVNKKKFLKEYLIVLASCTILVLVFVLAVFTTKGPSRAGDLISFNSPQIAQQVDYIRKISMPSPLTSIFENKFTIFTRLILTKLFKSVSFDYLFLYGDQFYSILRHGFFYVLDALFLVLGISYAYSLKKKAFFLLGAIALIGILPQIAHSNSTDNFSIHLSLMFAVLPIFMGIGISQTLELFKNRVLKMLSLGIVLVLYLFLVFNFLNIYFFQFPLGGYFDFHVRLLSKYAQVAKGEGKQVLVYSPNSTDIFKKYIFYTNSFNKDTYLEIRKDYRAEKFTFGNIKFLGCDRTIDPLKIKGIVVYDSQCGTLKQDEKHLAIPRLSDGGQSYQIFNDNVCSGFNLKRYPTNLSIKDFAIEDMGRQKFCETYITSF